MWDQKDSSDILLEDGRGRKHYDPSPKTAPGRIYKILSLETELFMGFGLQENKCTISSSNRFKNISVTEKGLFPNISFKPYITEMSPTNHAHTITWLFPSLFIPSWCLYMIYSVFENQFHFMTRIMKEKNVAAHKNVLENYKLVERKGLAKALPLPQSDYVLRPSLKPFLPSHFIAFNFLPLDD